MSNVEQTRSLSSVGAWMKRRSQASGEVHGECTASERGGFTLLELLIAIGLTSILMVALFSAMDIYFKLQLDSFEEITRGQVSRTLLRQMTRDIQSVVFVKKQTVGDTTAAMLTYTSGVVGSATDLLLYVSRPDRTLSYVDAQSLTSTSERTGDLMIVRYLVADTGSGGLSATIAKRFAGTKNGPIGLVRITGDLYGMSTAVQAGEEPDFTSVERIDAEEVSQVAFSYYDGANWQEEWDSTIQNGLPVAIEIILTLRNAESSDGFSSGEPDPYALGETKHRMVVALPLAEPFIGETAL